MTVEAALQQLMIEKKWTLSLAESCTGGHIAMQLTRQPGASSYFLGSLVTYSNDLKVKLLHVSEHSLRIHGAVSKEVAIAMWHGLLQQTGSTVGLAVTGIAGPDGGSAQKPVGLVHAAFGKAGDGPVSVQLNLQGSRAEIIRDASNRLLQLLYDYLN